MTGLGTFVHFLFLLHFLNIMEGLTGFFRSFPLQNSFVPTMSHISNKKTGTQTQQSNLSKIWFPQPSFPSPLHPIIYSCHSTLHITYIYKSMYIPTIHIYIHTSMYKYMDILYKAICTYFIYLFLSCTLQYTNRNQNTAWDHRLQAFF